MTDFVNQWLTEDDAARIREVLRERGKVMAVDFARKLKGLSLSAALFAVNKLELDARPAGSRPSMDDAIRSRVLVALVSRGMDAAEALLGIEAGLGSGDAYHLLQEIMAPYHKPAFASGHAFSIGPERALHPDAEADIKLLAAQATTNDSLTPAVKLYRAATGCSSWSEALKAVSGMR